MKQLQERIQQDLANTPYGTEPEKRVLLKTLLAEIKLKKGNNPSDEDVLAVVRKFKENAIECNNSYEILVLNCYLPQMMRYAGVKFIVEEIIAQNNFTTLKDLGKIMSKLKEREDCNLIDKAAVNEIAKGLLSK